MADLCDALSSATAITTVAEWNEHIYSDSETRDV